MLALDTSSRALSIALGQGEPDQGNFQILASQTQVLPEQHGVTLAPQVQGILKEVGWAPQELEGILVGIGPGSYTGLRIGVTFAKIWAQTKNLALYQVSSLALMAANVNTSDYVIPIMDARRGTAYTGLYKGNQTLQSDRHTDYRNWLTTLKIHGNLTLVGTDIEEFIEITRDYYPDFQVVTQDQAYPNIANAFGKISIRKVDDIGLIIPNYGHETLAEQEWRAKGPEETQGPLIEFN